MKTERGTIDVEIVVNLALLSEPMTVAEQKEH